MPIPILVFGETRSLFYCDSTILCHIRIKSITERIIGTTYYSTNGIENSFQQLKTKIYEK